MKKIVLLCKLACGLFLCIALNSGCKKTTTVNNTPGGTPGGTTNGDSIANHLLFLNAVKKQGSIPTGPAASSLKISFEDTLYISNDLKGPIKFLHEDSTQNVAGVFLQVSGSNAASFYYDVPEIEDMADNDTVSVILIGVNPGGLIGTGGVPPANGSLTFDMTIVAYDENKQAIASAIRPVKISKPTINENGSAGACGLQLPPGDFWMWDLSLVEASDGSGTLSFYNDPKKVWGEGGQFVTGCCINGVSSYNTVFKCEDDPTKARRKLFPTFFQHQESAVKFFNDGRFTQFSRQIHANPAPDRTNFCSAAEGAVDISARSVEEVGTWTVTKGAAYKGDSLRLTTLKTGTSGGNGLVSPRGFIHQLDCNILVIVQPNNEVANQDFVSFYYRVNTSIDGWYDFL